MGQCKRCRAKGFFIVVGSDQLCYTCREQLREEVTKREQLMDQAFHKLANARTLSSAMEHFRLIEEQIEYLRDPYDACYISLNPTPDEMLEELNRQKALIVKEHSMPQIQNYIDQAELALSAEAAVTEATKALARIAETRRLLPSRDPELESLDQQIRTFIWFKRLNGYLEAADKAEFKGQLKKAIDQYQEALYFLKNDGNSSISHEERAVQTANIQSKLDQLLRVQEV